ncbi:MAG: hypothetical protein IT360_08890 [Gemmatimonadaceae bacterium]|nr:hypothetical protein [Gemmatimonadaceae bacterium]
MTDRWDEHMGRAGRDLGHAATARRRRDHPSTRRLHQLASKWDAENAGVAPDIEGEKRSRAVNDGHDPQLERAVQKALRLLDAISPKILTETAPPVRVKRS